MIDAGAGTGSRFRPAQIVAVLLGAAVLGAGVGVALHALLVRSPKAAVATSATGALNGQATWAAGARPAPAIAALHDQNGRPFSLAALHGRTVAMTFFDSHCNQACPLEGRALARAEHSLPAAQRPVLVVVSVNPHDTPASSRAAARRWGLAQVGAWYWLRGAPAELARVWKAYHIFVAPPRNGDIAHTEAIYLIGRRGDERSAYLYPFATRFVSSDLRTLASQPNS